MSLISDVARARDRLDTGPRPLRRSAFCAGGALVGLAIFFAVRARYPWLRDLAGAAGVALIAAGALTPARLRTPYRLWMTFALALGWVMSRAVLVALFALVLTPIAVAARLLGKRFLALRADPGATTYWIRRPPDEMPRYEKMY